MKNKQKSKHECSVEGCKSWEQHLQYLKQTPMDQLHNPEKGKVPLRFINNRP